MAVEGGNSARMPACTLPATRIQINLLTTVAMLPPMSLYVKWCPPLHEQQRLSFDPYVELQKSKSTALRWIAISRWLQETSWKVRVPATNTAAARLEVSSTNRELPCSRSYSALVNSAMLIDTCLVCCFTVTLHRPKYSVLCPSDDRLTCFSSAFQVSISPIPSNSLPNFA